MTEFLVSDKVVSSESAIKQLCSRQDLSTTFKLETEENWMREEGDQDIDVIVAMDGHGHDLIPGIIREMDLKPHFMKIDPCESIQQEIEAQVKNKTIKMQRNDGFYEQISTTSGSTISFAKIYRNLKTKKVIIKLEWMGDSPIIVFINGELVFESTLHSAANPVEIDFLEKRGLNVILEKDKSGIDVINETTVVPKPGMYYIYGYRDRSAVTRSLGHNRKLAIFESQKHVIECSTDDDIKVIVMSDGVSDVMKKRFDLEKFRSYSAKEIVDTAENRWKQEWIVVKGEKIYKYKFPEGKGYDDCCCAVWTHNKLPVLEDSISETVTSAKDPESVET
jgi:serine/threonine protein phosphatase PrpC